MCEPVSVVAEVIVSERVNDHLSALLLATAPAMARLEDAQEVSRRRVGLVKAEPRLVVVVEPAVGSQHLLRKALLIHRAVDVTYDGILGLSDAELGEVCSELVVLDVREVLR